MRPGSQTAERVRVRVSVGGAVQGVGFRPFVHRIAAELGLAGWVANAPEGLVAEVEGREDAVGCLLERIRDNAPGPARVLEVGTREETPLGESGFHIRPSEVGRAPLPAVVPDLATCRACLEEVFSGMDRRHLHAFASCAHCGPRFSISESLPFDRERTSMGAFTMCADCRGEYENPRDRRFHAQTVACPRCGPRLELWNVSGATSSAGHAALLSAADLLRRGGIVAVKGLGGFHLMADAREGAAIERLRAAKGRPEKPFALMAAHVGSARALCALTDLEATLLGSEAAPIVVARRQSAAPVHAAVAPQTPYLGVMLANTPLHHLLLSEVGFPLVATSGNREGEPLCTDEREALEVLGEAADALLVHDRRIVRPLDDSLVRVVAGRPQILRRGRGYAPLAIDAPRSLPRVLAVGAHQKNTVAIARGRKIVLSQHVGDLESTATQRAFRAAVTDLQGLYQFEPEVVACDAHPGYASSKLAHGCGLPVLTVQHHFAHVLACMAEHDLAPPVLGVAWDGTGHGSDGTVWGGEFLRVTDTGFERVAHLRTFPLPGGAAAMREPRRSAFGLLEELGGDAAGEGRALAPLKSFSDRELGVLRTMMRRGVNAPRTSSMGRLFDAVASLLDLRQIASFEGQAAAAVEFTAEGAPGAAYPFRLAEGVVDWGPMVTEILAGLRTGETSAVIASRFHATLAEIAVAVARRAGLGTVVLSGGCFQNRLLLEQCVERLEAAGYEAAWPRDVPPNDGGIALGQALAAADHSRS